MELVFLLPILFLLTFGIVEYGWAFLKAGQIADAARHGVRYAITPQVTTVAQVTDPDFSPPSPCVARLRDAGIPVRAGTVTVPTGVSPGIGKPVTVEVAVPYEDVKLFGLSFVPIPKTLRASVSMLKEGY